MATTNNLPLAVDDGIVRDRLDMFLEILAIGSAIADIEQRHGLDLADERQRQQRAGATVIEQLRFLLIRPPATVH